MLTIIIIHLYYYYNVKFRNTQDFFIKNIIKFDEIIAVNAAIICND